LYSYIIWQTKGTYYVENTPWTKRHMYEQFNDDSVVR